MRRLAGLALLLLGACGEEPLPATVDGGADVAVFPEFDFAQAVDLAAPADLAAPPDLAVRTASFAAPAAYAAGGAATCIAVADFDGDGHPDVADCLASTVAVLPGDGKGASARRSSPPRPPTTTWSPPTSTATATPTWR